MIAGVSALALFLIMLIFKWFGNDFGGANAWESFSFIDIILFITILVAVGVAVMSMNAQSVNLPVAGSALVAGLGILSILLILFRIIDPPDFGTEAAIDQAEALGVDTAGAEIGRKIGVFLGFIAAVGIAYGGYRGMQEEGTSFGAQADRLQNRDAGGTGSRTGGTPPPPPPPAETGGSPPPRDPGGRPPPRDPGGSPPPSA